MSRRGVALLAAAAGAMLLSRGAAAEVGLCYRGEVGRVAEYRLSLQVSGTQTSLGERRPVRIEAQVELREEVVATGPESTFSLRVTPRPLEIRDPSGTFGKAGVAPWPEVLVRMTARGEVLAASTRGQERTGPAERSFASLMMAPITVILPSGPVSAGESWEWEGKGARQTNRLLAIRSGPAGTVARIASRGSAPVSLWEKSEALGVAAALSGEQTQGSELDLLVGPDLVLGHKGRMQLRTTGEITMEETGGVRRFPLSSEMRVEFDLRLVRLDGRAIAQG